MKEILNIGEHTKMVTGIYVIVLICILFYFFKNFKTIDYQLKIILVFLFFGFSFAIYYGLKEDEKVKLLKGNFSLTSGNVEEYFIPRLTGRGAHKKIKYIYNVNGKFIENYYQENYYVDIPNDKPDLSVLYLVIYQKTNPKNSFILLNYPVNRSEDLDRYKKMFKVAYNFLIIMKEFFNLVDHTKMIISIFGIIILFVIFYIIKNFKIIDIQLKFC